MKIKKIAFGLSLVAMVASTSPALAKDTDNREKHEIIFCDFGAGICEYLGWFSW